MSDNQHIFPVEALPFRLRWDWLWEAGIVDVIREPIAADEFAELRKKGKEFGADVHAHNERNANWVPLRFALFFAAIRPGEMAYSRWVCVGEGRFHEIERERGLWSDMLNRLAGAHGGALEHPPIYPLPIAKPLEEWVYPPSALVLDTTEGLAAALPWERAWEYMKLNRSQGR
jgi:hypothetical protein